MRTPIILWLVIVIIVVGGFTWYVLSIYPTVAPASTTATTTSSGSGADSLASTPPAVEVASSTRGAYLTAQNGMTLYTYQGDGQGISNCSGSCAQTWPPYTVPAGTLVTVPLNVNGVIATITRQDGTYQVVYNGLPLYFYSGDTKPGDTNGVGISAEWQVATP